MPPVCVQHPPLPWIRASLERLSGSFKERTFDAGKTVAAEGESGAGFFVIESGDAIVDVGGEEVRRLGPGDYLGDIALIDLGERTASIRAEPSPSFFSASACGLNRDEALSMNWMAKDPPASNLFFSHGRSIRSRKSRYTPRGSSPH